MKISQMHWCAVRFAAIATLGALAACGGGGDSGPQGVDITAANRDTVSHAAAAGIAVLSSAGSAPNAGTAAATRSAAQSLLLASSSRTAAALSQLRHIQSSGTADGRESPLALIGPLVDSCLVSGTVTTSVDDRDGNNQPSPGDVLTLVYNNCKDTSTETLNGTITASISQVSGSSFSMLMTLSQLADVAANHTLTLNGSLQFDYAEPSATVQNTTLTVRGAVVAGVATPAFDDTVTLRDGYVESESFDSSVAPPSGGTNPGRTITRVNGSLQSAKAGGVFDVSTAASAPLTTYADDPNPRSGTVQVKGSKGTLLLTALSTTAVQLDLDANDDGSIEASAVVAWSWLL